jgi:hypothetical protein
MVSIPGFLLPDLKIPFIPLAGPAVASHLISDSFEPITPKGAASQSNQFLSVTDLLRIPVNLFRSLCRYPRFSFFP